MVEFKFPDVGEGITEGILAKWLVKVGDSVTVDQSVAEVETDKSVVEIPSPANGVIKELRFSEGDVLHVGQVIMVIDESGAPSGDTTAPAPETKEVTEPKPQKAETPEVKVEPKEEVQPAPVTQKVAPVSEVSHDELLALPKVRHLAKELGVNLASITPSRKDGRITEEEVQAASGSPQPVTQTVETQKDAPKVEVPATPVVKAPAAEVQATPEPQSAETKSEAMGAGTTSDSTQNPVKETPSSALASPATRKLAREKGVDINTIQGSGPAGRVLRTDLTQEQKTKTYAHEEPRDKVQATGSDKIVPLSPIREAIAHKMQLAHDSIPQVTHVDEVDVSELVAIRNREKERLKEEGVKLTYLPFMIKSLIATLKQHPLFNAHYDEKNKQIILKSEYNIGVAVDTKAGLMVPVIKNADRLSIIDIAKQLEDLAGRAREKKLRPDEMKDSTFTVTSIGSLGGEFFTPIINFPEVAILGIGQIVDTPVVRDGEVVIRKVMHASISFDHRVVDGANAARFTNTLKNFLQDPEELFLELK